MVPKIDVPEQEAKASREGYVHRALVGFDQFANVLLGGSPDETISARAYRASLAGKRWGKVLNGALNLIQKDHGAKAAAGDLERSDAVEQTEDKTLGVKDGE